MNASRSPFNHLTGIRIRIRIGIGIGIDYVYMYIYCHFTILFTILSPSVHHPFTILSPLHSLLAIRYSPTGGMRYVSSGEGAWVGLGLV